MAAAHSALAWYVLRGCQRSRGSVLGGTAAGATAV
jgi:hypothetical protein